jgi:hypothetical protein
MLGVPRHMSIPVFVPTLSEPFFPPSDNKNVIRLLRATWKEVKDSLEAQGIRFPDLSLRSLVSDLKKLSIATQT